MRLNQRHISWAQNPDVKSETPYYILWKTIIESDVVGWLYGWLFCALLNQLNSVSQPDQPIQIYLYFARGPYTENKIL